MRYLFVLVVAFAAACMEAQANVCRMRGGRAVLGCHNAEPGPPPPPVETQIENQAAVTVMMAFPHQSSGLGFCDGGTDSLPNSPYTCGILDSDPTIADVQNVLPGAWMPCYDPGNLGADAYGAPMVPYDPSDSACSRGQTEQPNRSQIAAWQQAVASRGLTALVGDTVGFWAGEIGTDIVSLCDTGGVHWARFLSALNTTVTQVAANGAMFNSNGQVVVRGGKIIQGESDEAGGPFNNATYQADLLACLDLIQTTVKGITGQTSDIIFTHDQPTNWRATVLTTRSYVSQAMVQAATERPWYHVLGSKGHTVPPFGSTFQDCRGSATIPDGQFCTTRQVNSPECGGDGECRAQDHSFEDSGQSPLHWSGATHNWVGWQHGMWQARKIFDVDAASPDPGIYITSAVATGTNLRVCWRTPYGNLVEDTAVCPAHWNGDQGFELLNTDDSNDDSTLFVGAPEILTVAQDTGGDPNCIDFTTDVPMYEGMTRFEAGYRGHLRSGNNKCWGSATIPNGTVCTTPATGSAECGGDGDCILPSNPSNGCADYNDTQGVGTGQPVLGAPYLPWHGSGDPGPVNPRIGTPTDDWMSLQSVAITGGEPVPINASPAYVDIGDAGEYTACPNEGTGVGIDVFQGKERWLLSWWIDTEGNVLDNDEMFRKWASFRMLMDVQAAGMRASINIGAATNFSTIADVDKVPLNTDGFTHIAMLYDGTGTDGTGMGTILPWQDEGRIRWYYDCERMAHTEANIPTSMINSNNVFQIGNRINNSAPLRWRELFSDTRTAAEPAYNEHDILALCRSTGDLTNIPDPQGVLTIDTDPPDYYLKPSCADVVDAPDGVTNLGTRSPNPVSATCSGINHEFTDKVIDNPGLCGGAFSGFIPSTPNVTRASVGQDRIWMRLTNGFLNSRAIGGGTTVSENILIEDVSAGRSDRVWFIQQGGDPGYCMKPDCPSLVDAFGPFGGVRISADENFVYVVSGVNQLYHRPSDGSGGWSRIFEPPAGISRITATGTDWIWATNANQFTYACPKPCQNGAWVSENAFQAPILEMSGGTDGFVYVIRSDNRVWREPLNGSDVFVLQASPSQTASELDYTNPAARLIVQPNGQIAISLQEN